MENFRKSVLFLFGVVFFTAVCLLAHAETVEEKKAAVNYDESFPAPGENKPVEVTPAVPAVAVAVQPAQAVASPVQVTPIAPSMPQAVTAAIPAIPPAPPAAVATPKAPEATPPAKEAPKAPVANPPVAAAAPKAPATPAKTIPEAEIFVPAGPSGLIEVSGYKYPVYLFAPKDYKLDRTYAMVMLAPAESAKAEKQIEYLTGLAQRKSIFILAPYVLWPKAGDTPYTLDQWLFTVKKDVIERYPINPKRVYLVGKDSGAHYAAYIGVKYPREFAAVALLGQAWDGQFTQLVNPHSDPADQVPFFIALKASGDAKARNQAWFDKLQKRGYPLHLVDYQTDEDLTTLEFKKTVFDWLEDTAQNWAVTQAESQKNWKGKFKKGVKDFFTV